MTSMLYGYEGEFKTSKLRDAHSRIYYSDLDDRRHHEPISDVISYIPVGISSKESLDDIDIRNIRGGERIQSP